MHTATFVLSTGRCGTQWLTLHPGPRPGAGCGRGLPRIPGPVGQPHALREVPLLLDRLHAFLGLPPPDGEGRRERVDLYRHPAPSSPDFSAVSRHPRVLELAAELGYDPGRAEGTRGPR